MFKREQGTGVFQLWIDKPTGKILRVEITRSTGYEALDRAAVVAFRRWRLRAGTDCDALVIPVTFTSPRGSNHTIQPTAGPRTASLSMTKTYSFQAELALASGG